MDVSFCHRLYNGSMVLQAVNKKSHSAYKKMIEAIKSGKNPQVILLINFSLTRRRNNLLYEVRQLKKSKKIAEYYTDEFGKIKVLVKIGDKKIRITSVTFQECPDLKTFTIQELKNITK